MLKNYAVAVLGRGSGGLGPSVFVQAPQFFHRLLITAPHSGARPPRVFWLEPSLKLWRTTLKYSIATGHNRIVAFDRIAYYMSCDIGLLICVLFGVNVT